MGGRLCEEKEEINFCHVRVCYVKARSCDFMLCPVLKGGGYIILCYVKARLGHALLC